MAAMIAYPLSGIVVLQARVGTGEMTSAEDQLPRTIYLSPPVMGATERDLLLEAFDSGWIAPLGPHVDAFESEFAAAVGVEHAAAMVSGTAALHLALEIVGVRPGDEVVVPTLTFVASASAATYLGASPVFVDCDPGSWTIDPQLLEDHLGRAARRGRLPAAVVTVDLYGQCADYDAVMDVCGRYEVPVVEDAAEALGASYRGRPAGSLAPLGVFSFNGNKIITTSGGGMLVSPRAEWIERARYLATQARQPVVHYEHTEVGFNYRMSNLLAAVGRGQLRSLDARVAHRRAVNAAYRDALGDLPGIGFMPEAGYGGSSWWLTCITVAPDRFGATRDDIQQAMAVEQIEARPTWKPLHLQPAFAGAEVLGGAVAERIFADGLCLPSGFGLTDSDLARVVGVVRRVAAGASHAMD
jgi:dTDP-4-amino-4,6-dideoxygalactose transaminase